MIGPPHGRSKCLSVMSRSAFVPKANAPRHATLAVRAAPDAQALSPPLGHALPRMSALAEVQWTQPARKNYQAFLQRLTRLTQLFERKGYTYAKHLWPKRQMPSRWQF